MGKSRILIDIPDNAGIVFLDAARAAITIQPIRDGRPLEISRVPINKNQVPTRVIVPLRKTRMPRSGEYSVSIRAGNVKLLRRTKCCLSQQHG